MSSYGQLGFGKFNFFGWLRNLTELDIAILTGTIVPVNGTSGTYAKRAGVGCLYINTAAGTIYINGGTKASPTWNQI